MKGNYFVINHFPCRPRDCRNHIEDEEEEEEEEDSEERVPNNPYFSEEEENVIADPHLAPKVYSNVMKSEYILKYQHMRKK